MTFLLALLKSKTFWMIAGAVALALALIAFVAYRDHGIRVEERAKWQVKLQECNDAVEVALRANETLQQSASRLTEQIREQNQRIQELVQMEQAAQQQKNAALAKVLQKERQLREEVSRLTMIKPLRSHKHPRYVMKRLLSCALTLLIAGCSTAPKVVTEVKTVEVQVPVRAACLTPAEIPAHPTRAMRPEADVRGLAAGAVVELRAWEIYYEKVSILLAGCAK